MTSPAAIKQADMRRLAAIANDHAMTIEVEADGKVFRFIPGIHNSRPQEDQPVDLGKGIRA